jgi:DNA-binding NarL/FixJ family response regulator
MVAVARQVLLVEDEPLLASLMGQVLTDSGLMVRVCTSETEARSALRSFDPDAALIDVHLGSSPSGLYLAHSLSRSHPHVGILLLSRYEDLSAAGLDMWELPPGSAFLRKDQVSDRQVLLAALDGVLRGRPMLPATEVHRASDDDGGRGAGHGALAALTRPQLAVLRLAALGLTNTAIAARRETSERSVERLLRSVYVTLRIPDDSDVNPRVEAVRRYVAAAGLPVERGTAERDPGTRGGTRA